jgi:hypothetical protein
MKLAVLTTLMQERASVGSAEAVRALNSIDIIFKDSKPVRDAWANLYQSFDPQKAMPPHVHEERLRALLQAIAQDVGLGDGLTPDDFQRVYSPKGLVEQRLVQMLVTQNALASLTTGSGPLANTASVAATSVSGPYPALPAAEAGPQS